MEDGRASPDPLELSIVIRGGPADGGEVDLEAYRASLAGWQALLELGGRLFYFGDGADPSRRARSPFELRVKAPERGSVATEIVLQLQNPAVWAVNVAMGVAGNAAYDIIKTQTPRFVRWVASLIRSHIDVRAQTRNFDAVAESLRQMVEGVDLPANEVKAVTSQQVVEIQPMFVETDGPGEKARIEPADSPADRRSVWLRQIIESLDTSLEEASRPIATGCTSVDLIEPSSTKEEPVLLRITPQDREGLLFPMSSGEKESEWQLQRIKFRRIDRDSGSVMFRFVDLQDSKSNQFGQIADPMFRRPHNPYTQALDGDVPIAVWVHAKKKGGKRSGFSIRTSRPSEQLSLVS
jgi:hypothetical protein